VLGDEGVVGGGSWRWGVWVEGRGVLWSGGECCGSVFKVVGRGVVVIVGGGCLGKMGRCSVNNSSVLW
jgi:hypothetical protein